jgi:predicted acetyltransferase
MRRQLDDIAARGEPLAVLVASETGIYGRFGYGPATELHALEIERAHSAFVGPEPGPGGMRLVDRAEAGRLLPEVYERVRRRRVGEMGRSAGWWEGWLQDPEFVRDGATARFYAVWEPTPGQPGGYAAWRMKEGMDHSLPGSRLIVAALVGEHDAAREALWRFLLGVDLVSVVSVPDSPPEEPVRNLLADSRRLRTTGITDHLWVRLVDVPAALAARRYALEDRLTLEVRDAFLPPNEGVYELVGGPDGAACRPAAGAADLALDVADLGSLYLGGVRPSTLGRAGRVRELTPGALRRADAMFATDPAPYCATDF